MTKGSVGPFDSAKIVENAQKRLGIEHIMFKKWPHFYALEEINTLIREKARNAREDADEGAYDEINKSENILLFAVGLLRAKIQQDSHLTDEDKMRVAGYAYKVLLNNKFFTKAAFVAEHYLDEDKLKKAIDKGKEWYIERGNLSLLDSLVKKYGVNVEDFEWRKAVENAWNINIAIGKPNFAARAIEKYWKWEPNTKERLIHIAISNAIVLYSQFEDTRPYALQLAIEYNDRYGFNEREMLQLAGSDFGEWKKRSAELKIIARNRMQQKETNRY